MTPVDEVFNDEMERTRSMRGSMADYAQGYAAGLMRARFGELAFQDEYQTRLAQMDPASEHARGFRDGYSRLSCLAASHLQNRHAEPVRASSRAD